MPLLVCVHKPVGDELVLPVHALVDAWLASHTWAKTGVNSGVIVVGDPVRQELFQMSFPKRDQEVQAFPSDRADQSLTGGVCLWRSHRCLLYSYAHRSHRLVQLLREDAISVMDQKTIRMFLRERLAELLERPFSTRMRLPSSMITNT